MPDDALSNVLERCCGDTLLALAQTCTRLRRLVDEDSNLWRASCVRSGWSFTWWHPTGDESLGPSGGWKAAWLRRRVQDAPVNRLLVVDKGSVSLAHPTPSLRAATRLSSARLKTLPSWCPFGKRVAYVEVGEINAESAQFQHPPLAIVVAAVQPGSDSLVPVLRFVTYATPFYLHWHPDGQHLSYLVPQSGQDMGIALYVVPLSAFSAIDDAGGQPLARRAGPSVPAHPLAGGGGSSSEAAPASRWLIAPGMPLFYSFSPARDHQVVINCGASSQRVLDYGPQLDGSGSVTTTRLPVWYSPSQKWGMTVRDAMPAGAPANFESRTADLLDRIQLFQAPAYTHDGRHTVSVVLDLGSPFAVAMDVPRFAPSRMLMCVPSPEVGAPPRHRCITAWSRVQRNGTGAGNPHFAVSPDGTFLVCSHEANTLRLINLRAALAYDADDTVCTCTQRVTDDSDKILDVHAINIAAFCWSPCSKYLLILTDALPPFGAGQWGRPWRRWNVHCVATGRTWHAPAPVLLTALIEEMFLPFQEQYFRGSCTLWAPDSSAFCYAALDEEQGTDACFVQDLASATWDTPDTLIVVKPPTRVAAGDLVMWSPR